ncbi:MAG: AMP-binding protein [Gammaproteobacteria bacterium]|nr:AMP-binding protein [Gammaproteobacteria bacterium]
MHQNLLSLETLSGDKGANCSLISEDWCIRADGTGIKYQQHRQDVHELAARLPETAGFALNLCKDRYHFLVAFLAVALKGQTNLLPPNQAPGLQRELLQRHDGCYILCDEPMTAAPQVPVFQVKLKSGQDKTADSYPDIEIPADHTAAILFTSGTSGKPIAIHKRWDELEREVILTSARFDLKKPEELHLVATVPPQHMFGLAHSIMLPLACGIGFISNRPFFPEEIHLALKSSPGSAILITTPIHLQACINSDLDWGNSGCSLIISATAPLSQTLAAAVEKKFGIPVNEIYGSTETGAIASRRTLEGNKWRFYPGISAQPDGDGFLVSGGHLISPRRLSDHLQIHADGHFKLLGRHSDLIKLAGKRASLFELNQKLNQIDGVVDGVFIDPAEEGQETRRLAAIVVAPGMSRKTLKNALAEWIDPVFLPRPLLFVDALPRNETGKLTQQSLAALLKS